MVVFDNRSLTTCCSGGRVAHHISSMSLLSGKGHEGLMANWKQLLCATRFSRELQSGTAGKPPPTLPWLLDIRLENERDYDRVLFSSPMRRLGDKTQVFPLEAIESVRTRLTHSHEVASLARSVGIYIAQKVLPNREPDLARTSKDKLELLRSVSAVMAAIGLVHDLGNPPFGHQGEKAIRDWVDKNAEKLWINGPKLHVPYSQGKDEAASDIKKLTDEMCQDFSAFEGNAQTLRVVTRLQVVENDLGLNLTYGTLAALMKYTVSASRAAEVAATKKPGDHVRPEFKKFGYFLSETDIARYVREQAGLQGTQRHPLAYVMEACDDIAYSILDTEDAVKKQLVSFSDVITWIESKSDQNELCKYVVERARVDHLKNRQSSLSPAELNDVSMQKLRVYAINGMLSAICHAFNDHYEAIMDGDFETTLLEASKGIKLCKLLKEFARVHAYKHRSVLEIELRGYNIIHELMDFLWRGIVERQSFTDLGSDRLNPFAAYAYGRISENYRRIFEGKMPITLRDDPVLPIRYRELQLLTDMVSGMTDSFALELHKSLKGFHVGPSV